MYKDRPETHHLAYSAVTKVGERKLQPNDSLKFRPHDATDKHTHRSRLISGEKDKNADLAFLRNTVGHSSLNNANLLNTHHLEQKKIDSSLRQTMNISSNVKDLFKSSYQPNQKRSSRAQTFNQYRSSNKNDQKSPTQNDRLQKIMNKFDKEKQTKQALKLLQELKQLKRKQEELKKQRKYDSIKQVDTSKQDISISIINQNQQVKKTPISYDVNSPVNFSKKNRIDYSTPTYGNKSESTYPRSPQEESFQRHKKSSFDFTDDNFGITSNIQPYHRSSYKEPQGQSAQTLLPHNLSKSTTSLKPYYEVGGNSTQTSSKNSSSFAKLTVKDYLPSLSFTETKYEKDYRPTTSYRTSDEYSRSYQHGWNANNNDKEQYHTNYSRSPNNKYSPKEHISSYSKYDSYSSNTAYSNTPLRNVFSNRKITINDFHLGKNLGEGKFGTVYQAFDKKTKSIYALKKIPKSVIKSHWMIDQFILQVKLQQFCNHPNILSLHGCFDDSQNVYILLQYMEGGTLFLHLKKNTTLGQKQAAIRIKEMASAIQYLHENGIAHRDLKPQNIVMSHGVCKLCDFGWATLCDQRRKTYCGTFDYAAPEILQGEQYDMSVDLWCLGILAYEILVGKAPFYHISRKETMKKIMNCEHEKINYPSSMSHEAKSFIEQLLKRNPEERLKSQDLLKHPFILLADK